MNIWHDISPKRITPDDFYAVIEISKGDKNKYELDKETGSLGLTVTVAMPFPFWTATNEKREPIFFISHPPQCI